jgi:hypothetical protein
MFGMQQRRDRGVHCSWFVGQNPHDSIKQIFEVLHCVSQEQPRILSHMKDEKYEKDDHLESCPVCGTKVMQLMPEGVCVYCVNKGITSPKVSFLKKLFGGRKS